VTKCCFALSDNGYYPNMEDCPFNEENELCQKCKYFVPCLDCVEEEDKYEF